MLSFFVVLFINIIFLFFLKNNIHIKLGKHDYTRITQEVNDVNHFCFLGPNSLSLIKKIWDQLDKIRYKTIGLLNDQVYLQRGPEGLSLFLSLQTHTETHITLLPSVVDAHSFLPSLSHEGWWAFFHIASATFFLQNYRDLQMPIVTVRGMHHGGAKHVNREQQRQRQHHPYQICHLSVVKSPL